MYKRLCNDFEDINVSIKTSIMSEKRFVKSSKFSIEIYCPDGAMINYLKAKRKGIKYSPFDGNCLILDELDNYPAMVKTALLAFMNDFPNMHYIVASATFDETILESFKKIGFYEIEYNQDIRLIKHKIQTIHPNKLWDIVKNNPDKKIGIIANSISGMEELRRYLLSSLKVIFHHAQLTEYERLQNEDRLFNGEFSIVVSNNILAYSVDIDFDILIMELSDDMAINLLTTQRGEIPAFFLFFVLKTFP